MRKLKLDPKTFKLSAEVTRMESYDRQAMVAITGEPECEKYEFLVNARQAAALGSWFQELSVNLSRKKK